MGSSLSTTTYRSWGRYPPHQSHRVILLYNRHALLPPIKCSLLAYGNGRSYGDSCLNANGVLLHTRGLDRFIAFNPTTGVIRAEAGVLLAEILDLVTPQGWFLPVTPGTRFVTLGGAIANDVHGKNHHRAGTFGNYVRRFELLRSDGLRLECTPTEHANEFQATIGGLGLTGLITWAEIQLRQIANPWIVQETIRFSNLEAFFALSAESDRDYEYTVAWLDCAAQGNALGRGLFMRGNHAPAGTMHRPNPSRQQWAIPVTPPVSLINGWNLRAFNAAYYHRQLSHRRRFISHYQPFFYPLDGIREWNRIYGSRGFLQYQCVIPSSQSHAAIQELLKRITASGMGSFLAVLKIFGAIQSPGWLSFPQTGATLALDFPNRGATTLALLENLDQIVSAANGRVYPAKDARLAGVCFRQQYPAWQQLQQYRDPQFSSSFWRRVTA